MLQGQVPTLGYPEITPARPEDTAETVLWLCTANAGGLHGECVFVTPRP